MACPNLVSDYSTPELKWYQTDLTVVIRIQIIDAHNYYLLVQSDYLIFSTSNNKEYCFILYLFGGVIPEETTHRNVGREVKIYLTKTLKWYPWLRLTKSKEKNPFISYDQENLCTNQPQRKYIVKVQRGDLENKNDQAEYILPFDESSEEESDDDSFYDL